MRGIEAKNKNIKLYQLQGNSPLADNWRKIPVSIGLESQHHDLSPSPANREKPSNWFAYHQVVALCSNLFRVLLASPCMLHNPKSLETKRLLNPIKNWQLLGCYTMWQDASLPRCSPVNTAFSITFSAKVLSGYMILTSLNSTTPCYKGSRRKAIW